MNCSSLDSDSCNLCRRKIEKPHERYLFESKKSNFSALSETKTFDFEVQSVSSHVCRQCIDKLKKRRNLLNQLKDIEDFFKSKVDINLKNNDITATATGQRSAKKSLRFSSSPLKESQNVPLPDASLSPVRKKNKIDDNLTHLKENRDVKQKSGIVNVQVQWPSKISEKKLSDDLESLGKMLVRGTYKQIANAAWKSQKLRKELVDLMHKEIDKEITDMCSKKNPSCLRKTTKKDMMDLTMTKVADELQQRAPLFHSFLSVACTNSRSTAKQPKTDFAVIGMVAGICLRNRSKSMIAIQLLITTFIYHSSWLVSKILKYPL